MLFSYPLENNTILFILFSIVSILSAQLSTSGFSIKYHIPTKLILFVISLIFGTFLLYNSFNSFYFGLKWNEASKLVNKDASKASIEYEKLYQKLKRNRSFVLNQGSIYFKAKQYERCTKHYEKYKHLFISADMYLMLGESYEQIDSFEKAEENYKLATFLIPHLFIPRYKLFKLYLK
jgi:tetratricopeptide (TPR) repeat protein